MFVTPLRLTSLTWIASDANIADIFAKPLDAVKTLRITEGLGLTVLGSVSGISYLHYLYLTFINPFIHPVIPQLDSLRYTLTYLSYSLITEVYVHSFFKIFYSSSNYLLDYANR
jgi:hypothetical protein